MTHEELSHFTYNEINCLTYSELQMPLKDLLKKLVDENRPVPISFYNKLCELCDEVNSGKIELDTQRISELQASEANSTIIVKKPKNLGQDFIKAFKTVVLVVKGIEYLQDKFAELIDWFMDMLD